MCTISIKIHVVSKAKSRSHRDQTKSAFQSYIHKTSYFAILKTYIWFVMYSELHIFPFYLHF